MKKIVIKNGKTYEYELIKKNIKNMYMRSKDGIIVVSAPILMPTERIEYFVENNITKISNHQPITKTKRYVNGEIIRLFGLDFVLEIEKSKQNLVRLKSGKVVVGSIKSDEKSVEKLIHKYRYDCLANLISERIEHFRNLGLDYDFKFKLSNMKTRWGCCYYNKGLVTFSMMLSNVKQDLIDYVIVHEICHFKHPNHSKEYWNYVSKYIPNYKELRKELKKGNSAHDPN